MRPSSFLILALLLVLKAGARQAQAQVSEARQRVPKLLKFGTSYALSPTYTIQWNGNELKSTLSSALGVRMKTIARRPTRLEWRKFWKEMDAVKIWNWRSTYTNFNVLDGVGWHITIEQSGRSAKRCDVMGSNAYPSSADALKSSRGTEPSRRYQRFVKALLTLAGKINVKNADVPLPE